MNAQQLYLKPDEGKFLALAVLRTLDEIRETEEHPWTPAARKDRKDMLTAGTALRLKLEKLGFDMRPLPDYEQGDEDEFLTKQS